MTRLKKIKTLSRRDFLKSTTSAGLGLAFVKKNPAKSLLAGGGKNAPGPSDELRLALIGAGEQGRVLMEACLRIPGLRFAAVCDIWQYSREYASGYLNKYGQKPNVYLDYRELLDNEKDLDAAIVATPDWMHAEHAIACLEAGLHVYCEKEMSNSLDQARRMVLTARRRAKLLQIGHQRRSNPRYIHVIDRLIREKQLLGRMTAAYAQWNRARSDMLGWPKKYTIDPATLEKYGYSSMLELRNWRWFKKYGGGPIVDLGSHQIDLFAWALGANPSTVTASGPFTRCKQQPGTAVFTRPSWEKTVRWSFPKFRSAATGPCARRTRRSGTPWSRTGFSSRKSRPSRKSTRATSS
jgi:predicted dehydrogenase